MAAVRLTGLGKRGKAVLKYVGMDLNMTAWTCFSERFIKI